jgi:hypothetical protein
MVLLSNIKHLVSQLRVSCFICGTDCSDHLRLQCGLYLIYVGCGCGEVTHLVVLQWGGGEGGACYNSIHLPTPLDGDLT